MGSVKCIFNGRLGNQLFQLAHVIGEGIDHQVPVILGEWDALEYFPQCKTYPIRSDMPIVRHIECGHHYKKQHFIPEYCNEYSGYYQTEKYFEKYRDVILTMLTPKVKITLSDGIWCAIHIRRGDYLQLQGYHPSVPMEYYKKAIEMIAKSDGYIVFSDDIPWCKENLTIPGIVKYETDFANNPIEALSAMSKCKHIIGSNSSFSWWGAYLGDPTGMKIFPQLWFGPNLAHLNLSDLIPQNWHRI